ncbi:hypothetical protein KUTeg_016824 [Tegillarca granosa]|uniref:Uncharacterized protein n=1 Tax=Tegillarca granosa TaxID=220873 RepID=A0ABQ9EM35_TEGGR|nr:hypothetical protein KUTeg_016824 [Tegillarca granosa]
MECSFDFYYNWYTLLYFRPPTPRPGRNGYHDTSAHSPEVSSVDSGTSPGSPSKLNASIDSNRIDDEHRLIARYAARLAADTHNALDNDDDDYDDDDDDNHC